MKQRLNKTSIRGRRTLLKVPKNPQGDLEDSWILSYEQFHHSFSQAPPITSMEPAFRLRMRGDLLGRPGPSGG